MSEEDVTEVLVTAENNRYHQNDTNQEKQKLQRAQQIESGTKNDRLIKVG